MRAATVVRTDGNAFRVSTSEWLEARDGAHPPDAEATATTLGGDQCGAINPPEEYDGDGVILPAAYARHAVNWCL